LITIGCHSQVILQRFFLVGVEVEIVSTRWSEVAGRSACKELSAVKNTFCGRQKLRRGDWRQGDEDCLRVQKGDRQHVVRLVDLVIGVSVGSPSRLCPMNTCEM
jgi:hypothetical protein